MIQRKYFVTCPEEVDNVIADLNKIGQLFSCSDALLLATSLHFSYEKTEELLSPIRKAFPTMKIAGLSVFALKPFEDDEHGNLILQPATLVLNIKIFSQSNVSVHFFDLSTLSVDELINNARSVLASEPGLRAVGIYGADHGLPISRIIEAVSEGYGHVPMFGTMAEVLDLEQSGKRQFIFGDIKYESGLMLILYTGSELHVHADYIFGWKPIGKAMSITVSDDLPEDADVIITSIDGIKPEAVFKKYFGIGFDEHFAAHVREFPLAIERNGTYLGRIPIYFTKTGDLVFLGSIRPDEKIYFTYALPDEVLGNTYRKSLEMKDFGPESLELYICANRSGVLGKKAFSEIEYYADIIPGLQYCYGGGEIYMYNGQGTMLNSALVAVGMREGSEVGSRSEFVGYEFGRAHEKKHETSSGMIPFSIRVLHFLKAMTGDLSSYAREAERANKAKSLFLAKMSHELRTPINAVLGMDEMILRESKEEGTLSYATDIMSAGKTLLSLLNDILDFSKVEEGRMEIVPVEYELGSMINDLVNMIKERSAKVGLTFNLDIDNEIPHVLYGDEIRIRQCAMNLLTNAVKYTDSGSVTLKLSFKRKGKDNILLTFCIADTGIGIREEDMEKLFAPFSRIEEERNRLIEGTGLGVNITKQLLNLMGSTLKVESTYGKGSKFSFTIEQKVVDWEGLGNFSVRYGLNQTNISDYKELFTAPSARVMVVDDMPVNLTVFTNLLKRTRIRIDTAMSGKEALRLASINDYDVIFIDHMMPEMDGIETFNILKEYDNMDKTAFIALTANAISGAREMYLSKGFSDYLSKPIDTERLERMLLHYLPADKVELAAENATNSGAAVNNEIEFSPEEDSDFCTWLMNVPGLNALEGVETCGDHEGFLTVLTVFYKTAEQMMADIKEAYSSMDLEQFTTKVHGLKSSARIVGASELSALARDLEDAGRNGDKEFILDNTDRLLDMYSTLIDNLGRLGEKDSEKPDIDPASLDEAYQTMEEIAESMEYALMEGVLSDLKEYRLPEDDSRIIEDIGNALLKLDWDEIRLLIANRRNK